MRVKTNSLGHRGPEMPAAPGGRLIFLGDSMTSATGSVKERTSLPWCARHSRLRRAAGPGIGCRNPHTGTGHWLKSSLAKRRPTPAPRRPAIACQRLPET